MTSKFWLIYLKALGLFAIEDILWWSIGKYTNLNWWQVVPIILLIALLFVKWGIHSQR